MSKASRMHRGDEFGKFGAGNATAGMGGPMIGAGAAITVDGIVERESGVTPPPPPISVKALAVIFSVMFVFGIALVWFLQVAPRTLLGG